MTSRHLVIAVASPIVILLFVASTGWAQEITAVFPPAFENVEGSGLSGTQSPAGRFQQVYLGGSAFPQEPETHRWITEMRWRPDSSVSSPETHNWSNVEIRFSTTAASPGNLSLRYADNVGPDETLVLSGPLTVSTMNSGPSSGPKDFDMVFAFQTPFRYDPNEGNLLMDITWLSPFTTAANDTCCLTGDPLASWISVNNGNPFAEFANTSSMGGGISQFIFVPEPTSSMLCLLALPTTLLCRGGQRRK